jgi:hypothetical protein
MTDAASRLSFAFLYSYARKSSMQKKNQPDSKSSLPLACWLAFTQLSFPRFFVFQQVAFMPPVFPDVAQ